MGRDPWDAYVKISDALEDQPGLRMIYCDGRLAFVGKSRRHEWLSECSRPSRDGDRRAAAASPVSRPGKQPIAVARKEAGLEGDRTFHFGATPCEMRGG